MGKPPVIVITRHGARLDAENRSWHETSSTPYDPPLTYGGWLQAQALGRQIEYILHERESAARKRASEEQQASTRLTGDRPKTPKRKKHKVVIHSSPYLRCIQSAIGISAGISHAEGTLTQREAQERPHATRSPRLYGTPARSKTLDSSSMDSRYRAQRAAARASSHLSDSSRPLLRVDAVLGEWLNPEYFEKIKPPPSTTDMLNAAMAQLAVDAAPMQGTVTPSNGRPTTPSTIGNSGESHSPPNPSPLRNGSITWSAATIDGPSSSSSSGRPVRPAMKPRKSTSFYEPPTPNYAIGNSDAIPQGYVESARDACIIVDDEWDSMQEPHNWGDGGAYGEEWSAMHRRFRRGLLGMVNWYKEHGVIDQPSSGESTPTNLQDLEEETEVILVIVTHSAGCNALIHALTNQPVLMDFGMASLTMALLKESGSSSDPTSRPTTPSRRSETELSQLDDYEMRIVASTDHLRAGQDARLPQLVSNSRRASMAALQMTTTSATPSLNDDHDRPHSRNAALGSIRRSRASSNVVPQTYSSEQPSTPTASTGLWMDRRSSSATAQDDVKSPQTTRESFTEVDEDDDVDLLSPLASEAQSGPFDRSDSGLARRDSQTGLWGSGAGGGGALKRNSSGRGRTSSEV